MSSQPFYIAFDEAHKTRGKITSNYKSIRTQLEQNGYQCVQYAEFPISRTNLAPYDILVFACPDNSKITKQEIDTIKKWVKEEGGGLLLLSHAGGDKGRRTNLSELAAYFAMNFENDQVLDPTSNLGVENLPLITDFGFPHPITEGIEEICFRAGCSLSVSSAQVTPVISSGPNADPFESPLILATEQGEGRVVAIGSYEMFRDRISGGIEYGSHQQLILNIMEWLKTTKRAKLKQNGSMISPIESPLHATEQISSSGVPSSQPSMEKFAQNQSGTTCQPNISGSITPEITFKSNVKILAKKDLFKAFEDALTSMISFKERMTNEFNTLNENLQNLMRSVLASEEDLVLLEQQVNLQPEMNNNAPENTISQGDSTINSILDSISQIQKSEEEANTGSELTPQNTVNSQISLNPPPGLSPPPGVVIPTPQAELVQSINTQVPETNGNSLTGILPGLTPLPPKPGFNHELVNEPETIIDNSFGTSTPSSYQENDTTTNLTNNVLDSNSSFETPIEKMPETEPETQPIVELAKSKEELEAELSSLENKLNSIRNLRSFVEKKFQSGKLTQPNYDKQIKKLDNDTNKTKFRIDEINEIIKKL